MSVEARLPDGTILRFPEGTPDGVVDRAVQKHLGGGQQQAPPPNGIENPRRTGLDAARAREARNRALVAPATGGFFGNITDSLTAPVNDEIAGGVSAAGQAIQNGLGRLMGRNPQISAADAYRAASEAERAKQADFDLAHPKASFAAQVMGGFAIPGGGAKTLLGKAASIAAPGAAYGAAGAEGGVGERAAGAATGAALALGTAGAIKGAGMAASPAIRGAANAIADRTVKVPPGVVPPDMSARVARQGARFVERVAQSAGKDVRALTAGDLAGKGATAAEAIGRPGVTHLSALARRSGQTADVAEPYFAERAAETGNRLLDDIANATGAHPEAARGSIDAIVEQGRAKAAPLFDAALSTPGPIWNRQLEDIARRPVVKRAIQSMAEDILNEGGDPVALGLSKRIERVPGGGTREVWDQVKAPTAQTWDTVKKAIGRQVERNPVTGKPLPDSQSQGNYGVGQASKALTSALRENIPGYGAALDASGEYLTAEGAFNRVKGRLFSSKTTPKDFVTLLGSFKTGGEAEAAKSALASDLFDRAQNGQLKPGGLRVPAVRAKLEAAFGKIQAEKIAQAIEAETKLAAYGGRIRPGNGSPTDELRAARAEQDGANPLAEVGMDFARGLMDRRGPASAALGAAGRQLGKAGATLKAPGMPVAVRDEAGRLLMMNPEELAAYLSKLMAPTRRLPSAPAGLLGAAGGAEATAIRRWNRSAART